MKNSKIAIGNSKITSFFAQKKKNSNDSTVVDLTFDEICASDSKMPKISAEDRASGT